MLIFPYASREQRLRAYIGTLGTVRLYAKKVPVSTKVTLSQIVEAPSSIGYAPIKIAASAWRFEPSGTSVRAVVNDVTWRFTAGGATIFGHYALDYVGALMWVEALDEPFEVLRANEAAAVRDGELQGSIARYDRDAEGVEVTGADRVNRTLGKW